MKNEKPKPDHPARKFFFKEWRRKHRLTQERLAELAGVTPPSISQLENGHQGFRGDTLIAIADAMGCHPGELLMIDPFKRPGWKSEIQNAVDLAFSEGASTVDIRAEIERIVPLQHTSDEVDLPMPDDRARTLREFGGTSAARLSSHHSKSK